MEDRILNLRKPRSKAHLVLRWLVALIIALIIAVPVLMNGGAWIPLTLVASIFLLLSAVTIGIEWFAAETIEFRDRLVRLGTGSGVADFALDSMTVERPFWLKVLKGGGLLVKSVDTPKFVLVLGEKKVIDQAAYEFATRVENRIESADNEPHLKTSYEEVKQ